MKIRFTVKTIERLCQILRGQVDDVRRYEREIRKIVADDMTMPAVVVDAMRAIVEPEK